MKYARALELLRQYPGLIWETEGLSNIIGGYLPGNYGKEVAIQIAKELNCRTAYYNKIRKQYVFYR